MPHNRWLTPGGLGQRALTPADRERIRGQIARLQAMREELERLLRDPELNDTADKENNTDA